MKTTMPLPLELTRPIEIAPLETGLRKTFGAEDSRYNPVTQVRESPDGMPRFLNCGGETESNQESESTSGAAVIDVTVDLQIDDNDF